MSAKGEQTRQEIVQHAVDTVAKDGFGGISIGALARDLGLSKSGLFAHFRSKEQLQLAVLAAAEHRFVERVVRPALQEPRGAPRVHALFGRWLRYATLDHETEGGCIFVGAATELDDSEGTLRDAAVRAQDDWIATLARAARIAVEERHFRSDLDCDLFAFEAYGILLGRHLYTRFLRHPQAPEFTVRALQALLRRAATGATHPQPSPEFA
jgi:AcrR family transcriptional regulator